MFSRLIATYRRHRHVVTSIGVAMLATAIGLVVVGGVIRVLQAATRQPPRATPSGTATTDWTASLGAPVTGLAIEENRLYVASDQLAVFPVSCVTDAGRCGPRWRDAVPDRPLSVPLVIDDRVFVGSADGKLYAFAATCGGEGCTPDWIGIAGEGPVSQPVANFDLVYATSDELYAFPVGCASDGLACTPAWSADVPGRPADGPAALGDGLVVVASSSKRGGVFAYPAVCGAACEPVWTARFDGPATSAAIGDGFAYTVARGRLLAFPASCAGRCEPEWRAHFATNPTSSTDAALASDAVSAPVVAGGRVFVGGSDGRLWVFASTCDSARCEPIASYDVATTPLLTPVIDGDTALITSASGSVTIVDLACETVDPCLPVTVLSLGSTALTPAVITPDSVIAGADDGSIEAMGR
ncbi:MAG: PQQ-binding-like beta-propeller repeat protein [Actinomycetota bacterium]